MDIYGISQGETFKDSMPQSKSITTGPDFIWLPSISASCLRASDIRLFHFSWERFFSSVSRLFAASAIFQCSEAKVVLHPDGIYLQTRRTLISRGVDSTRCWKSSPEIWPLFWHDSFAPLLQIRWQCVHAYLSFRRVPTAIYWSEIQWPGGSFQYSELMVVFKKAVWDELR